MFDTIAGKLEGGPYSPKNLSRTPWEIHTKDYLDCKSLERRTSVFQVLNKPEARIAILHTPCNGDFLRVESSLPKLLYGNNLSTVVRPERALRVLKEFVCDFTDGPIPDLAEMESLRADFCHNFDVGSALPDYVRTLSKVDFLKHSRTTDGYEGVEWWGNGRMVRFYDKYQEILEKDKKRIPAARGKLRFEVETRKQSRLLQRRLKKLHPTLGDVLDPHFGYCILTETLSRMCLDFKFVPQDEARKVLDEKFSFSKATRLLGLLRRLETETMTQIKSSASRGTFYRDKAALRELGLLPPSATKAELPGLSLPPLEQILDASGVSA
jgi:hypothetical protein